MNTGVLQSEASIDARTGVGGVAASMEIKERSATRPAMSESDLAEVLGAFNDVTAKLHAAHESLGAEVIRLRGELRAANEQIERSRRLAALGEMAAGIAHEIRNPLGSIRLYARMLSEDLKDRPTERSIAEKIAGATRGMDAVVTDVLAFSRETKAELKPVELEAVVAKAIDECIACDREEQRGRAAVEVCIRGEAMVQADAGMLHRAVVNVVRNGIQAMREVEGSGAARPVRLEVAIEERVVPEADGTSKRFIAILVRDHGPGLPVGIAERMFNPFFTTRATGTGLGLAIVHRIIDAHGGRVSVRNSDDSVGAVAELLLPMSESN
jgi:signal transduction histidine kinase